MYKFNFDIISVIIILTQIATLILIIMSIVYKKSNPSLSKKISKIQRIVHIVFMIEISLLLIYLCLPSKIDKTDQFSYYKNYLFIFSIFTLINAIVNLLHKPVTCQEIMTFIPPSSKNYFKKNK